MTTRELRDKAADFVERGWCQRAYALNAAGERIFERSLTATCWCVYGALHAAMPDTGPESLHLCALAVGEMRSELRLMPSESLDTWNDAQGRTQAEVVAALRGSLS